MNVETDKDCCESFKKKDELGFLLIFRCARGEVADAPCFILDRSRSLQIDLSR